MIESEMPESMFYFSQVPTTPTAAVQPTPEEQTIDRACRGDQEAFSELYRKYAPLVNGILLSKIPYDDVKDNVQEVFLSAYRNLHTLRDKQAIGGWLATIARNRAIEFYRQSKPTDELPEEVRGKADYRAEAVEIMNVIRSLPDAYRETLTLRLVEGMTGNEIAEKTGLTPESVRVNLHRGMEMLRQKLGIKGTKR
jgi:RNA polymerase sigma-70 factor, ECF subfamily